METIIIEKADLENILTRLEEISKQISAKEKKPSEIWLDQQEVMQLLKVSRRTIQSYRDHNMLSFSIIGNKLYYKMSDVEDLLNRHYRKRLA